ncbi:MAG: hypothetical protein SV377_00135 [Halobacteria archaeon]|nr:hypothetical protein [Halobacteria archaeon]
MTSDEVVRKKLEEGAWEEALDEWKRTSNLTDEDLELIKELGLLEEYEFFWDPHVGRVGFESSSIPKNWKSQDYADKIKSWGQVSKINMALSDLGDIGRRILEEEYLELELK